MLSRLIDDSGGTKDGFDGRAVYLVGVENFFSSST